MVNVLLLEDVPSLQRATSRMIRRAFPDATVKIVDTCGGAIAALRTEHFDFIVSDYEVLDGTADKVLRWVRDTRPQLLSRFVFFSAMYDLDKLHDKVIEKGCSPDEFTGQLVAYVGAAS